MTVPWQQCRPDEHILLSDPKKASGAVRVNQLPQEVEGDNTFRDSREGLTTYEGTSPARTADACGTTSDDPSFVDKNVYGHQRKHWWRGVGTSPERVMTSELASRLSALRFPLQLVSRFVLSAFLELVFCFLSSAPGAVADHQRSS